MQSVKFVIAIVPVKSSNAFTDYFKYHGVKLIYTCRCDGTARSKTLHLLGLEKSELNIIYAMCMSDCADALFDGLSSEMGIDAPGAGVVISLPVSETFGISNAPTGVKRNLEERAVNMENSLIIVIAENGYVDMVMDAAREAGARGGTVVHAKGTGNAKTATLFKITIAQEKEMIYLVTSKEDEKKIVDAIIDKAGPTTKAKAVVFTLPIERTAGFAKLRSR